LTLAGCGGSSNNSSSGGGGGNGGGGNTPTTVTYTFTVATPTAVATQTGTGAYQAATLQSNKLTLSIPSGTTNYSVAFACPPVVIDGFTSNMESVVQRSTLDGTDFTEGCFNPTPAQVGLATVQVDPSAISGAAFVGIAGNGFGPEPWSGGTLSLSAPYATGTYDLFLVVYDLTGQYPLAVRVLRSQTIPGPLNGGNTVVFTAADETTKQTITYANLPAGWEPEPPEVTFYTSAGAYFQLVTGISADTTQYPALPPGALQSGDYYTFLGTASAPGIGGSVGAQSATSTGTPQTLTFPSSPWTYLGPTPAVLPTFTFSYAGFSASQPLLQLATVDWTQGFSQANPYGTSSDSIVMSATGNYQNGATTLTIPDLTALAGFIPSPASGTPVDWTAGITQGSGFQTTPPTGTAQAVDNSGTYTAP
jgi:hypothetical protein